jgi:hypothetical protein
MSHHAGALGTVGWKGEPVFGKPGPPLPPPRGGVDGLGLPPGGVGPGVGVETGVGVEFGVGVGLGVGGVLGGVDGRVHGQGEIAGGIVGCPLD